MQSTRVESALPCPASGSSVIAERILHDSSVSDVRDVISTRTTSSADSDVGATRDNDPMVRTAIMTIHGTVRQISRFQQFPLTPSHGGGDSRWLSACSEHIRSSKSRKYWKSKAKSCHGDGLKNKETNTRVQRNSAPCEFSRRRCSTRGIKQSSSASSHTRSLIVFLLLRHPS